MKNYAVNRGDLITTHDYKKIIEIDSQTVTEKVNQPSKETSKEKVYQKVRVNKKQGRK